MSKIKTVKSDLLCHECGSITSIQRRQSNKREKYHIKDLYCYKRNKATKHIELKDCDFVKAELLSKDELKSEEEKILKLINPDNNISWYSN
ncbi:MAG: hypothetical protein J6J17_00015 [Bacilli bacterium]|nr:hypothetical protein [Bacilli bacterium]